MFKETKKERNIELENIFEVLPLFLSFFFLKLILLLLFYKYLHLMDLSNHLSSSF